MSTASTCEGVAARRLLPEHADAAAGLRLGWCSRLRHALCRILDNLPIGIVRMREDDGQQVKTYERGFPVGFMDVSAGAAAQGPSGWRTTERPAACGGGSALSRSTQPLRSPLR